MNKPFALTVMLLAAVLAMLAGCHSMLHVPSSSLPPVLSSEEITRPYTKIGRIQVIREVFITDLDVTSNITEWGLTVLREEAAKMGADAVMLPEVTGKKVEVILVPATEYKASGIAIKFRK